MNHDKNTGSTGQAAWFWTLGLSGRVTMVLLLAIAFVFIASALFYEEGENYTRDTEQFNRIGERLAVDARVLLNTTVTKRAEMGRLLSTDDMTVSWLPAGTRIEPQSEDLLVLRNQIMQVSSFPPDSHFTLVARAGSVSDVVGALRLADQSVMAFIISGLKDRPFITRGLFSASLVSVVVLLAAFFLVRALSLPLRVLARAADKIGRGPQIRIKEKGPMEVRYLARAINGMQERISRLLQDRTQALAAVSHDLRTPLARLRLRAGFLEDTQIQQEIESDVLEMETMLGEVLAFLAGENNHEEKRKIDLAVLLQTLVDEAADNGNKAIYSGPDSLQAFLRPVAMKRVFSNIITNALNYAGDVSVTLQQHGQKNIVLFEDNGPGIEPAELEHVLTPFYRIETSRSRSTGGVGLGLAIVVREIEREGGTLKLTNRPNGGLVVEISLS